MGSVIWGSCPETLQYTGSEGFERQPKRSFAGRRVEQAAVERATKVRSRLAVAHDLVKGIRQARITSEPTCPILSIVAMLRVRVKRPSDNGWREGLIATVRSPARGFLQMRVAGRL